MYIHSYLYIDYFPFSLSGSPDSVPQWLDWISDSTSINCCLDEVIKPLWVFVHEKENLAEGIWELNELNV